MAAGNPTLRESIEEAEKEQIEKTDSTDASSTEEEVKDKEKDDKKDTDSSDADDADKKAQTEENAQDEEIQTAVNLYRALRDPKQQLEIITDLATRMGIVKPSETPTQKQSQNVTDLLREVLSEEYPDLSDKFTKILTHIDNKHQQEIDKLRNEISADKQKLAQDQFETEFSQFISENKLSDAQADAMIREIEALPPNPNAKKKITLTQYLSKIHKLVVADTKATDRDLKKNEKRHENLNNRSHNMHSDVDESRLKTGSSRPSIREAIEAASKGITFTDA